MQVIVDGMLTHYERLGKGSVVLILPGWADTSQSWLGIQKALSAHYDVVVLDIPGFGGSQPPAEAWGLNEYADFVQKFLHKVSLDEVYSVIGHSNGGAIAMRGISSSKISAKRLVLVASAGIRNQQKNQRNALRLLAKTGKVLVAPLPGSIKQKLRSRLYQTIGSDMLVAEHMLESFKLIVADDVQRDAAAIKMPTLLIYGDNDSETPLGYGQKYLELIQNSRLEIIAGGGHFLHTKNTDEVVGLSQEFLA